jgi:hypothetical protein
VRLWGCAAQALLTRVRSLAQIPMGLAPPTMSTYLVAGRPHSGDQLTRSGESAGLWFREGTRA